MEGGELAQMNNYTDFRKSVENWTCWEKGEKNKKGRNGQLRELNPVELDNDSGKILEWVIKQ